MTEKELLEIKKAIQEGITEGFAYVQSRNNPKPDSEYLTAEEVAQILRVSKQTVYSYKKQGILPYYSNRNNRIYFKRLDVQNLLTKEQSKSEVAEIVKQQFHLSQISGRHNG